MNEVLQQDGKSVAQPVAAEVGRDYIQPALSVSPTKDGYVVQVELPGVPKDGLSLNLERNILTLIGRRPEPEVAGAELLYRESRAADFRRVLELDPAIAAEKITANLEQGVLTLTLPKAEVAKPRQIKVG